MPSQFSLRTAPCSTRAGSQPARAAPQPPPGFATRPPPLPAQRPPQPGQPRQPAIITQTGARPGSAAQLRMKKSMVCARNRHHYLSRKRKIPKRGPIHARSVGLQVLNESCPTSNLPIQFRASGVRCHEGTCGSSGLVSGFRRQPGTVAAVNIYVNTPGRFQIIHTGLLIPATRPLLRCYYCISNIYKG